MMAGRGFTGRSATWMADALREVRSRPHRNSRRRRLHTVPIDRHHAQEKHTASAR